MKHANSAMPNALYTITTFINVMFRIKLFAVSFNSTCNRLFDMGCVEPSVIGGGGGGRGGSPHHNFAVIAPMIMKFSTGINVFNTKKLVTNSQTPSLIWRNLVFRRVLRVLVSNVKSEFTF